MMILADHAAPDPGGRLNLLGAGTRVLGYQPGQGTTAAFGLLVRITVPPALVGAECVVEIGLHDSDGAPVTAPGPGGEPQVVRIGHAVTFEDVAGQDIPVPHRSLRPSAQWAVAFPTGLPLQTGRVHSWRVRIDHETRDEWVEDFYVAPPPTPITLPPNGPVGPVLG
ncbi:MAG: hypothetical protein QG608_1864 [Actinomycetota bacterium]|nr:hypothetical protein [Actinomycetota bacterium]